MPDLRGNLLPIYVLADESSSMAEVIAELNTGLASLHTALLAEPMAAAKVRMSVIGFSDTAVLRLRLADLRRETKLPQLVCRNTTNYEAAFGELARHIAADIEFLKAQYYGVYRPAVFFLSDGQPSDEHAWRQVHRRLVDRHLTVGAPNIIACGIGAAKPATILQVATQPEYAFVSIAGVDVGHAIARFCSALTRSVIVSGRSLGNGSAELSFNRPEGFSLAIDVV
jgi:uncharacterized protein YegL